VKVVLGVSLPKVSAGPGAPAQISTLDGKVEMTGVGLTTMLKVRAVPTQVLAVGVTDTVALAAAVTGLMTVKLPTLPLPLLPKPTLLELVQAKEVFGVGLPKLIAEALVPPQ
jgi:hypothetical protein